MMLLFVLLAACSSGPSVTSVVPIEVEPGQALEVAGENFGEGAVVRLAVGDSAGTELVLEQSTTAALAARVPDTLAPGVYDLVVERSGRRAVMPRAVTVVAPATELPCAAEYQASTELGLAKRELVVNRLYNDGTKDTVQARFDEIERLEYELVRLDNGRLCSAVYVRRTDNSRFVFLDDREVDLKARAHKLAKQMSKPIETTRMDAEGFADADADPE